MSIAPETDSAPTTSLLSLICDGYRYARLVEPTKKRQKEIYYVGKPNKIGATHNLKATRIAPRVLPADDRAKGVIRIAYDDPANYLSFPDTIEGRKQADAKLDVWLELAKGAVPKSAVALPRGRAYKNFVQARTEAAKNGTLYLKGRKAHDREPKNNMAKKTPKVNAGGGNRNPDNKNGVSRPKEGTITGKVWDLCDKHDGERAAIIKEGLQRKIALPTITTQHAKWRKYSGLVGRSAPAAKKPAKKKPVVAKRKPVVAAATA